MITSSLIYLILLLDNIHAFLKFVVAISSVCLVITISFMLSWACNGEKVPPITKKLYIPNIIVLFFFILCLIFIPTTKNMAIILITPKIVNNEQLQNIPKKILELSDDWLNELSPSKMLNKENKPEQTKE